MRIKKILVPTDFSDCSQESVRVAEDLAGRYEAELTLLFVIEPPIFPPGSEVGLPLAPYLTEVDQACAKQLDALKHEVEARSTVRVTTALVNGMAAAEIARVAKDAGHDLIVLGTHGRTGIQRLLMGSVAEKVMHHAPCTVMIVRTPKVAKP